MRLFPIRLSRRKQILCILATVTALLLLDVYIGQQYSVPCPPDRQYYRWDRQTLWELRPFIATNIAGRAYHTNSSGLRGEQEYSVGSHPELRILILGDSRTYGMAVSDDMTYCSVLQSELRCQDSTVEVINAGTPGYTAVQCRAKLEQVLPYKPDIAVFAVGYNDRRYIVLTPPDSPKSFRRIALLRSFVDVLHWSKTLFAISSNLGKRKLEHLRDNPPLLNTVEVRVPPAVFRGETERFLSICHENNIQPFFLLLCQNPTVFNAAEKAAAEIEQGKFTEALKTLHESREERHVAVFAYSNYLEGSCYTALEEKEKARERFLDHTPTGSLHGEAVLRSQKTYFEILHTMASEETVPVLTSRDAIRSVNEKLDDPLIRRLRKQGDKVRESDLGEFFASRFIDECHYDTLGHVLIGKTLARKIRETYLSPSTDAPSTDSSKPHSSQQ